MNILLISWVSRVLMEHHCADILFVLTFYNMNLNIILHDAKRLYSIWFKDFPRVSSWNKEES